MQNCIYVTAHAYHGLNKYSTAVISWNPSKQYLARNRAIPKIGYLLIVGKKQQNLVKNSIIFFFLRHTKVVNC